MRFEPEAAAAGLSKTIFRNRGRADEGDSAIALVRSLLKDGSVLDDEKSLAQQLSMEFLLVNGSSLAEVYGALRPHISKLQALALR